MATAQYFAHASRADIAGRMEEKIRHFYEWSEAAGRTRKLRKAHVMSLGHTMNGTDAVAWDVVTGGEQGELLHNVENHFASVGQSLLNLTTAQRPAIQCGAANGDQASISAAKLSNGLVDYHLTERSLEEKIRRAAKRAIFTTEGFVEWGWDALAGDEYAPTAESFGAALDAEDGAAPPKILKKGEPTFEVLGPMDVIRDEDAPSWDALMWVITRKWVSKYEYAAKFPDVGEQIVHLATKGDENKWRLESKKDASTDLVPLYTLYHKRGAAVPGGRMVQLLGFTVVLTDTGLPYRDLPVANLFPDEADGSPFGHSAMLSLIAPQDTVNAVDSAISTNELGRGIGNILVPRKANIEVERINDSMNKIPYDGDKEPSALQWPQTPGEFFQYKKDKVSSMEVLSGLGSVARGNPSENVGQDASGAKLALLEAQAIRNNSGLERSLANLIRQVAQALIHLYQDFGGDVPRLAKLAGKHGAYTVKEFTASSLDGVDRVTVDMGNPMLRSPAGKMGLADKCVELGLIKPGELTKYLSIFRENTIEPLLEKDEAQQARIRGENERLMDGGLHRALISDPHWVEIPEHLSLLDNPALRDPSPENEDIQQAILMAVDEHMQLFLQMPPAMVLFRGGPEALGLWQQIQQMMAPPMPAPAPGEQSGTAPPEAGAESGTPPPASGDDATNVVNPEQSQEALPGMPAMPTQPNGLPAGQFAMGELQ